MPGGIKPIACRRPFCPDIPRTTARLSGMLAGKSHAPRDPRSAYITTQRRFPITQSLRLTPMLAALGLAVGLGISAGAQAQSIKIGVVGPTTGPVTQYGAMVREGVDTAVERINAAEIGRASCRERVETAAVAA